MAGKIDRISGSGNAMLHAGNDEYNLGPLSDEVVDKPVVAVTLSGTWAVCITPNIQKDQYLSNFISSTGINHRKVRQAFHDVGKSTSNRLDVDLPSLPEERLVEGNSFKVQIVASGSAASYVLFDDGSAVEIDIPFLPAGHETTIEIADIDSSFTSATLDRSVLQDAPEAGTELAVKIIATDGPTAYSLHNSIPVSLPNCPASEGDYVRTGVASNGPNGIKATVAALPECKRLSVGDSFELKLDLSPDSNRTTLVYEGLPVQIPAPFFPVKEKVPLTVTKVESNTITTEVDFTARSAVEFEIGQELSIEQLERRGNQLIGNHDGVPFTFSIAEDPVAIPDSLDVVVKNVSPREISVTIKEHPRLESVQSGDVITVPIDEEKNDHLFGEYRSFPVWIPSDGEVTPLKLTVAITHITDYGIFASVADLPDNAVPRAGQIVSAEIEKQYPPTATAQLETTGNIESYVVPVLLPQIMSDIEGKVGIEIIDRGDSHLIGILRTTNIGKDADSVPMNLVETQRALAALRYQSPAEAISAWKSAAEETDSELRKVDAKRSAIYGEVEEALKDKENGKAIYLLREFQKYLKQVDVPIQYGDDLENELDAYHQLITATQRESRDSLTGLQRIARMATTKSQIDQTTRFQVNQIAAQVPCSSKSVDNGWNSVFPHPYVVDRIQRLCNQLDSVPDAAKSLLNDSPRLEETNWSVAPVPADEPRPTETFDVEPFTPHLSDPNDEKDEFVVNSKTSTEKALFDTPEGKKLRESTDSEPDGEQSSEMSPSTERNTKPSDQTVSDSSLDLENTDQKPTPVVSDTTPHIESETLVVDRENPTTFCTSKKLRILRRKAEEAASDDPVRDTSGTSGGTKYHRAPPIRNFVKARADGVCEACGEPAPFETDNGEPYLEAHHVDELGKGGEDHPAKVVALCPVCHKRVHHGRRGGQLNSELRKKLRNGLDQVGLD